MSEKITPNNDIKEDLSVKNGDKKADPLQPKITISELFFRHASVTDKLLMFLGSLAAMGNGVGLPLMTIVFGDVLQAFMTYPFTKDVDGFNNAVVKACLWFTIIGVAVWTLSYFQVSFWMQAGENQTKRIRELYFEAVMRQDVGFFDLHETGELTTRLTADAYAIQEGISDKIGLSIQFVTTFLAGFVIAYIKGWKLALVLSAVFPLLGISGYMMVKLMAGRAGQQSDIYAGAGAIAQQVLSSMRTVTSFNAQDKEIARYTEKVKVAEKLGIKKGFVNGLSIAVVFCLIFMCYALAFWYGSTLVIAGELTGGEVLNVFFAIIIGAFSLGNASPGIAAVGTAQGSAFKVFEVIARQSKIDPTSPAGLKPGHVVGDIEFRNVDFAYPQRPDSQILHDFSLKVDAGTTVALVGTSGSGKSTIVKLLERFYDPTNSNGKVLLDSVPLPDLNVKWLRQQIGIVSQEPILFQTSIKKNLLYGLPTETLAVKSASEIDEMLQNALKTSNAWDFIQKLPKKMDTEVGEAGSMMSGGQKQRIAIARAILSNPKILLLDEATSALDTESERLVQESLDKAKKGRTTIVIAHRLSTVRDANKVVVMKKGKIVEMGTHQELIQNGKMYKDLVDSQEMKMRNEDIKKSDVASALPVKSPIAVEVTPNATAIEISEEKTEKTETAKEGDKTKEESSISYGRLFRMNSPEWPFLLVASISASINGCIMPVFAVVFSTILSVFGETNMDKLRQGANFWSLIFVALAAAAFIVNFFQISFFSMSGERFTTRIRIMCFSSLMRKEIGYFDEDDHSSGLLLTRLADDAGQIKGLTGGLLASIIQNVASMIAGLVIAFYFGWELTLVILAGVPIVGAAGFIQLKVLTGFGEKTKKAYNEAGSVAVEAIQNIRTVIMLSKEQDFIKDYEKQIVYPHNVAIKGAYISSFAFGFSQGSIFFIYAVAFYYGSRLILWDRSTSEDTLKVLFAIIFTAMSAGQTATFAPNFATAKIAANSVFNILDRKSLIDYSTGKGDKPDINSIKGESTLTRGEFSYPTRPDIKVLNGMEVFAKPGETIALVGQSGCGKSTIIALMERFYHLSSGIASLDKTDVQQWELQYLRQQMALVGQEPVLFNISIRDSIAYGSVSGKATNEEIEGVARMANIHEFIMSLPEGYDTLVGEKGGQLSGGQKQRIAIARALMRNPKLLLLDEATSALDSESEKVVQTALDAASKGRTTIVIAHRLSTIQNADHIFVVRNGIVIEHGKHFELLDKRGSYYELVNQQNLNNAKTD